MFLEFIAQKIPTRSLKQIHSFGIMLTIVKEPSGEVVPRFIFLFLAIHAVPSVWEILLLNTIDMKPFPFAVRIFTFDHFSE